MKFRQLEIPTVEIMVRHVDPLVRPLGGALRGSPAYIGIQPGPTCGSLGLPSEAGEVLDPLADTRIQTARI